MGTAARGCACVCGAACHGEDAGDGDGEDAEEAGGEWVPWVKFLSVPKSSGQLDPTSGYIRNKKDFQSERILQTFGLHAIEHLDTGKYLVWEL